MDEHACIYVNNYFNIWFLVILYNGLLSKIWWDKFITQTYSRGIQQKIFYIFMVFSMNIQILNELSTNLHRKSIWKIKEIETMPGRFWHEAQHCWPSWPVVPTRGTHARDTVIAPATGAAARWWVAAQRLWRPSVGGMSTRDPSRRCRAIGVEPGLTHEDGRRRG
jgi:hypothetical protein